MPIQILYHAHLAPKPAITEKEMLAIVAPHTSSSLKEW